MTKEEKFSQWAVVELMGHQKIAGFCTEQSLAGTNMLRVDVPATSVDPAFTRFIGGPAIYAINPVTEEIANSVAESIKVRPIQAWDINVLVEKTVNGQLKKLTAGENVPEVFAETNRPDFEEDEDEFS